SEREDEQDQDESDDARSSTRDRHDGAYGSPHNTKGAQRYGCAASPPFAIAASFAARSAFAAVSPLTRRSWNERMNSAVESSATRQSETTTRGTPATKKPRVRPM